MAETYNKVKKICNLLDVQCTQIMAKNVRTNVKKMVNHIIGVEKYLDPGITVRLLYLVYSNPRITDYDCRLTIFLTIVHKFLANICVLNI